MSEVFVLSVTGRGIGGRSIIGVNAKFDRILWEIEITDVVDLPSPSSAVQDFTYEVVHQIENIFIATFSFSQDGFTVWVTGHCAFNVDGVVLWENNTVWLDGNPGEPYMNLHRTRTLDYDGSLYVRLTVPNRYAQISLETGGFIWEGANSISTTELFMPFDGSRIHTTRNPFGDPWVLGQVSVTDGSQILEVDIGPTPMTIYWVLDNGTLVLGTRHYIRGYDRVDPTNILWTMNDYLAARFVHDPTYASDWFFSDGFNPNNNVGKHIRRVSYLDGSVAWGNDYPTAENAAIAWQSKLIDGDLLIRREVSTDNWMFTRLNGVNGETVWDSDTVPALTRNFTDWGYLRGNGRDVFIDWNDDVRFLTHGGDVGLIAQANDWMSALSVSEVVEANVGFLEEGILSLRLLQRDDDNDHGHPRIAREQVTSEQKSIRRGPGTYW